MNDTLLRDKFRGALLGTMVGDALGAPVEGWDCAPLQAMLDDFHNLTPALQELNMAVFGVITGKSVPPGSARYTDDTQMMIGVAESLIAHPEFDGVHLASRFAANFEGHRGYGPGAYMVLRELKMGGRWNEVGGRLFGGRGSYGNGAAMRVAPVGAFYHDRPTELHRVALEQSVITHTHILGKQGAMIEAAAVATALRFDLEGDSEFGGEAFIDEVLSITGDLEGEYQQRMADTRTLLGTASKPVEIVRKLGNGIEAHLSVPAALYAFAAHYDSFEEAVLSAIRLGGDTDTIGAMTGAIAGAFHGARAIPGRWLDALENGPQGRDFVVSLADQLFDSWAERR